MDQRSLKVLEFNRIVSMLIELTVTTMGKEKSESLLPQTEFSIIQKGLQETTEARRALRSHHGISLGGVRDIRPVLRRIRIGGTSEPADLLDVGDTLSAGRKIKQDISESDEDLPSLKDAVQRIGLFQEIERIIFDCISDLGEINDGASPELSRIRKQIRTVNDRIRQKLESYIRSSEYQKIIQEPIVTHREGRFVIPVRQESRGQFPGIIHDQSASGATLFIEPMAVVELNNELRQLTKKEQQEIERIIRSICSKIFDRIDQIEESIQILAYLDFVLAKGKLSLKMDAWEPELLNECSMNLLQARHPMLGEGVVPIDVRIGTDFNTLVITGPNTGGKTVALKTMGLLVLMTLAGLHIPAKHGSAIGVFKNVLADIGDEQSIEQSLSTFSGHMKNIIGMIEHVDHETLVLLDEIGAGTDPVEGAALAMAILEYLHSYGVKTAATTHYSELKAFAYNNEGIENASVEFDVETLRPTYRLTLGMPGHSNAFAIAQRLGLKSDIIEMAKEKVSSETTKVDDMIRSVSELQMQVTAERETAERVRRLAESQARKIAEREKALIEKEESILTKAKEEASKLLARVKAESSAIVRDLRKAQLEQNAKSFEKEISQQREFINILEEEVASLHHKEEELKEEFPIDEIRPGMDVFIRRLNQTGEVIQVLAKQNAVEVQAGVLKLTVPLNEIAKAQSKKRDRKETAVKGKAINSESANQVHTEIDLRGMTVAEAIEILEKHLDSALLNGIPKVNVIHGKGTGALRDAIRRHLTFIPGVKSSRPGETGEGGDGVTVVYFSDI
jgi:DNA mismatch repair protein MutS2